MPETGNRLPENCPLGEPELQRLSVFNGERARGLVHRPSYAAEMAQLQRKYDAWLRGKADAHNVAELGPQRFREVFGRDPARSPS